MSLYSRLDRLAADVEKLNKQVTAVSNQPQSQRTSVEGGSIDFNDEDGNLMAIVGGQDDGSNTIRHVDGPTPPIPSGLTAHVDGPIVQVSWDGTFETDVTHDWHYLEVLAVGPNNEQLAGTINDLSGGETSLAATAQGEWFIVARSVSRAEKRSLDGDAGTVQVNLVGLEGAIEAVQESADGKNTIYYSATMPPGFDYVNGDLWFDTSEEGANTASVWDGAQWMSLADARVAVIEAAQATLDGAMTELDGRLGTVETDLPQQIEDAQQAAIDAAALDATAKADAAQVAAESVASAAQQTADDALAAINAGESMWDDPGFESSFGPLGSTNPSVVRSTVHAYQGAWSVEYTTNGTGSNVYPGYISVPVTPGRTYRLSAAVRSDDGLAFESFFEQRASGSTVVSSPKLEVPGGVGSWALGDATQTVVDGVFELRFAPMVPAAHNNTAGNKLYLDNFTLTDITESYAMFQEAMGAAAAAQVVAGEAKAIAEAAVGAAEGGNTNFFNQSEPSGVGSLVGDRWFQRTATWAIIGMWMWDGSNWIRQTLNNEVIGNLDAGKITFGFMNGERIEAGSIYADRIVSGLSQNMVPDPGFVSPEINASRLLNNSSFGGSWDISSGVLSCDTNGGTMTNNSNFPLAATSDREAWSAYPGMTMVHRFSARVVGGTATVRGTAYTLRRDGTKAYTALTPSSFQPITSEWKEYAFTTALGDDITSYSTALQVGRTSTGVVEFKAPFSASMVGTTVIEGGAVTTNKLAANVLEVGNLKAGTAAISEAVVNKLFAEAVVAKMVTASEFIGENAIITGSITTPKLAVGAITAESGIIESLDLGTATVGELDGIRIMGQTIRGEQLSGDAIDGKVITGATVQSAASGARAVMSASGFEAFDATESRTFFADATTGDVNMTGSFYSNYDGLPRVEIDNDDWASIPMVDDQGATQYVNGSGIRIGSTAMDGFSIYHGAWSREGGSIRGQSAIIQGPLGKGSVSLGDNGQVQMTTYDSAGLIAGSVFTNAGGGVGLHARKAGVTTSDGVILDYACRFRSRGAVPDGSARSEITAYGKDYAELRVINSAGSPVSGVTASSNGSVDVYVNHAGGGRFRVPAVWNVNASSDGAVSVNSTGTLYRASSSLRYKQDVESAAVNTSVLDVEPRTWHDKSEMETRAQIEDYRAAHGEGPLPIELQGYSAEPRRHYGAIAEDVHDLGLTELVQYDAYGRPDSLSYDKFGVALIPVVRELRERIALLETKLENS